MGIFKKIVSIFLCISMVMIPVSVSSGSFDNSPENGIFIFDSEDMISYMSGINHLDISFDSDEQAMKMAVNTNRADPYALLDLSSFSLKAADYSHLVVTYKVDNNASNYATTSEIFVSAGSIAGPTGGYSVRYTVQRGGYRSHIIDLSALRWWNGDIHSLRIDSFASSRSGDTLYVDSIILCSSADEANEVASVRVNKRYSDKNPYYGTDFECVSYDATKYTSPFWKGNIVYSEAVSPIQNEDGSYTFNLMYTPDEIISVYSGDYAAVYEKDVDYTVSGNQITILADSDIPTWEYSFINGRDQNDTGDGPLYAQLSGGYGLHSRDDIFMKGYLNVTYTHSDTWDRYTPESKADLLPNTAKAIKNNEKYNIVLFGDSIAGGAVSSKYRDIFPYADYWYEQIETVLRENYGHTNLTMSNVSEGGSSASGMVDYFKNNILPKNPDLLILEFGVNDAQNESVSSNHSASSLKGKFKNALRNMIELAREKNPEVEVLIVSPFHSNITFFREEMFRACRDACLELEDEFDGVAVANVTDVQGDLLDEKTIHCFLGDNLCHPNDFMARIYAQTCLQTIIPEELGYDAYVPEGMEVSLEGVEVTKFPDKTSFEYGQKIDTTGMELTATYSDGSTKVVAPDSIEYDASKVGAVEVTVSYECKSATFEVEVYVKYTALRVIPSSDVICVYEGEELDLSNYYVLKLCSSYPQFNKTFSLTEDMIVGEIDTATAGEYSAVVSFDGLTAMFSYTVLARGDIDGDGKISMLDMFRLKLFISQKLDCETANDREADVNGDGSINMIDSFELKYRIKTGNWRR